LLDELFEQARSKVGKAAEGKDSDKILKNLILEGMYLLHEPKIAIRARKSDKGKVDKAIKEAAKEYKENMGKDVEAKIDEKNPIPDGSSGGVYIVGGGGKIEINNTFEERLKMCETDALPSVRVTLFGHNDNRHFKD